MHRCLELAERGRGKVGTNPLVGAVLVRGGKILAEGWHEAFGLRHAERMLLEDYKGEIRPQDTLYVNLEPCCHHGKTPPCTEIIIERGVKRVVYGMVDPDVRIAGQGMECLRKAQVELIGPVERARCEWLNRGFVSLHAHRRPWVTVRMAKTLSGAIANPDGSPLKITSAEQDRWTHEWLRARHDAILVGVNTVIRDNPKLNTRFVQRLPSPLRIVLDPHLRTPVDARVSGAGTWVITASMEDTSKRMMLEERGVRVEEVPLYNGSFDLSALWSLLTSPVGDFHGITTILIEGGVKTWERFRDVADEAVLLMGE